MEREDESCGVLAARIAIVPHEVRSMSMMKDPSQCLSQHVRWIDYAGEMNHDNVLHEAPMLQCKISDFDVTRAIRRTIVIDNLDCGIVVLVNGCRLVLSVSQFVQNKTQIFGDLGGRIGCYQFCFSRALSTDRLSARTIGNNATCKAATIAGCRSTLSVAHWHEQHRRV